MYPSLHSYPASRSLSQLEQHAHHSQPTAGAFLTVDLFNYAKKQDKRQTNGSEKALSPRIQNYEQPSKKKIARPSTAPRSSASHPPTLTLHSHRTKNSSRNKIVETSKQQEHCWTSQLSSSASYATSSSCPHPFSSNTTYTDKVTPAILHSQGFSPFSSQTHSNLGSVLKPTPFSYSHSCLHSQNPSFSSSILANLSATKHSTLSSPKQPSRLLFSGISFPSVSSQHSRRVTIAGLTLGCDQKDLNLLLSTGQSLDDDTIPSVPYIEMEKEALQEEIEQESQSQYYKETSLLSQYSVSSSLVGSNTSSVSSPSTSRLRTLPPQPFAARYAHGGMSLTPQIPDAVREQRIYRDELVQKALMRPVVSVLAPIRRKSLLTLLEKRPTVSELHRKNILKSAADVSNVCDKWSARESMLEKFLNSRPKQFVLESKNILRYETARERSKKLEQILVMKKHLDVISEEDKKRQQQHVDDEFTSSSSSASSSASSSSSVSRIPSMILFLTEDSNPPIQIPLHSPSTSYHTEQKKQIQVMLNQFLANRPSLRDIRQVTKDMVINSLTPTHSQQNKTPTPTSQSRNSVLLSPLESPTSHSLSNIDLALIELKRRQKENGAIVDVNGNLEPLDIKGAVWGVGNRKWLGVGRSTEALEDEGITFAPCLLTSLLGSLQIDMIACGSTHTLAKTSTGEILGWGSNSQGELGLGDLFYRRSPSSIQYQNSPLLRERVVAIAAGNNTSMVVTHADLVYAWGDPNGLVTGLALATLEVVTNTTPDEDTPVSRDNSVDWDARAKKTKQVYAAVSTPSKVPPLCHKSIEKISISGDHGAAVSKSGILYVWGNGLHGQLGFSQAMDRAEPVPIEGYDKFFF